MSQLTDMLACEANDIIFNTDEFAITITYTPNGSQESKPILGVAHVADTGQLVTQADGIYSIFRGILTLRQTDGNFGTGDTFNFALPTSDAFNDVNWKFQGINVSRLDSTQDVAIVAEVGKEKTAGISPRIMRA
jgi:hypothetical protein